MTIFFTKQGVALTGRNRTGPPCSVGPDHPRARPGGGRSPTCPADGPPAGSVTDDDRRRRRQTTDASEQNNSNTLMLA